MWSCKLNILWHYYCVIIILNIRILIILLYIIITINIIIIIIIIITSWFPALRVGSQPIYRATMHQYYEYGLNVNELFS